MNMNKVNTKYCTSKSVRKNYRDRVYSQEAACDGGVVTTAPTMKVTGRVVIDGKEYLTLTV